MNCRTDSSVAGWRIGSAVSPPGDPKLGPGSCQPLILFHSEEEGKMVRGQCPVPSSPASLWLPPGALIWGMVSWQRAYLFLAPKKAFLALGSCDLRPSHGDRVLAPPTGSPHTHPRRPTSSYLLPCRQSRVAQGCVCGWAPENWEALGTCLFPFLPEAAGNSDPVSLAR